MPGAMTEGAAAAFGDAGAAEDAAISEHIPAAPVARPESAVAAAAWPAGAAPPAAAAAAAAVEGVLLYYAYRDLRACQAEVRDWMEALCTSLGLVGRVRVALDGLNVTVGRQWGQCADHTYALGTSTALFNPAAHRMIVLYRLLTCCY